MIPLLMVAIFLPLFVLGCFGVFSIFEHGYVLHFIALLAACALLSTIPLWAKRKTKPESVAILEESFVEASGDWGSYDIDVWNKLNYEISQKLNENAEWKVLQDHALNLITCTSEQYHSNNKRKELAFTIPELLMMVEEISRRYRVILETHVPFIENFSLSLLKQGYDNKEKVKSSLKSATWFWNVYRLVRMVSPVSAIVSELRCQAINKLMTHVNSEVQFKLKQALLQEVVSVAIDLYSGRFKVDDEGLDSSHSNQEDNKRRAAPLDPLRVCLVGQVSSGKSSVINALTDGMNAEVNKLPSTEKVTVHQCSLEGIDTLDLVDLPGFDGDKSTERKLLKEVVNCDLVIWVLKANQPARTLDSEFKALLDSYYAKEENRSIKRPVAIGVLNQVDRLHPITEWLPPYELQSPKSKKAQAIKDAVDFNRRLLDFETLLPISVSEDKTFFNLKELEVLLDKHYYDGVQTQLNRRRNEAVDAVELTDQAKRVYQSGKSLFKIMKKNKSEGPQAP